MKEKEHTAEEMCKQHMERAKELIVIASQRIKTKEMAVDALTAAQINISLAIIQISRIYESEINTECDNQRLTLIEPGDEE